MSKRITVVVPDDDYAAFCGACDENRETMSGFLCKAIRLIGNRKLKFAGYDPTLIMEGGSAVSTLSPAISPATPPKEEEPVLPNITPKQYANMVYSFRQDKDIRVDNKEDIEMMIDGFINDFKCNRQSVRDMIAAHPPYRGHPQSVETDKFVGWA